MKSEKEDKKSNVEPQNLEHRPEISDTTGEQLDGDIEENQVWKTKPKVNRCWNLNQM